jgi:hypothetical protein
MSGDVHRLGRFPLTAPVDGPEVRCPDISLAASRLGWKPVVSLHEGTSALDRLHGNASHTWRQLAWRVGKGGRRRVGVPFITVASRFKAVAEGSSSIPPASPQPCRGMRLHMAPQFPEIDPHLGKQAIDRFLPKQVRATSRPLAASNLPRALRRPRCVRPPAQPRHGSG